MKTKMLLISLALVSTMSYAVSNDENTCMSVGKYGEIVANSRVTGVKLEEALPSPDNRNTKVEKHTYRTTKLVTEYIYMMEIPVKDAKKVIYLKCMAGQYDF